MIYLSTGAFATPSIPEMAAECARLGVGLEFTANFRFRPTLSEEVVAATSAGAPLLVHNYFPPPEKPFVLNLAATDPAIRNASHALCRQGLELTARLGAPFYSVHAGFAMNLTPDLLGRPGQQAQIPDACMIPRAEADAAFLESVRDLLHLAEKLGVNLLLENNVVSATHVNAGRGDSLLLTSPDECRDFFAKNDSPRLGLLLDVGHAKVSGQTLGFAPGGFFTKCSTALAGLHLSDNDGVVDSNRGFDEGAWFSPALRDFRNLPIVIETYGLAADERAAQIETLRRILA